MRAARTCGLIAFLIALPGVLPAQDINERVRELEAAGHAAMKARDYAKAERHFTDLLQLDPYQGAISYELGIAALAQNNPRKYELAVYSLARAVVIRGPDGLPAEERRKADAYLTKVFEKYAGELDGLATLKQVTTSSAFPPPGFRIRDQYWQPAGDTSYKDLIYAYFDLRDHLTGPRGNQVWLDLHGKLTPVMALFVASYEPAGPVRIGLSPEPSGPVEVILELKKPPYDALKLGGKVKFEGVAVSLTRNPFRLTLTDGALLR